MTRKASGRPQKWRLEIYGPNRPMYADGNSLYRREYRTAGGAKRAAANVRRMYPGSVAFVNRFELVDLGAGIAEAFGVSGFWTSRDPAETLWDDRPEP